jgi:hypothetical protein
MARRIAALAAAKPIRKAFNWSFCWRKTALSFAPQSFPIGSKAIRDSFTAE